MPKFTNNEIINHISNNSFYGITLDTCIIFQFGYDLEHTVLCSLDQFKSKQIKVLFSEIVAREVKGHIEQNSKETQTSLKRAIKHQVKQWKLYPITKILTSKLSLSDDPRNFASRQFIKFTNAINAEIVPALSTDESIDELLNLYFENGPPFEVNKDKKHEFPDAFALLSLEQCGDVHAKFILCVSADQGWKKFCDTSKHLVCVEKLEDALSYFNLSGSIAADRVVTKLKYEKSNELMQAFEDELVDQLDSLNFSAICDSPFSHTSHSEYAVLRWIEFQSVSSPTIIKSNQTNVTFTVTVDVHVQFFAVFNFYVPDSIDKDNVLLGSRSHSKEDTIEATLVIESLNNKSHKSKITNVEIFEKFPEIYFDYIEPFID